MATLSVAKPNKTPVLRDHQTSLVAGHGVVAIEDKVTMEGEISKKIQAGQEIISLAEDGVEWEMSLGVYGGNLREFENETINGKEITHGVVLEKGTIREVSFVILGADMNTSAQVFNVLPKKGDPKMKLQENAAWAKFACGCGGTKDSTPEELEQKFAASQEEIDAKQAEIDQLKADLAKAQEDLEKMKEEEETSVRADSIKAAALEKGIELSQESIDAAKVSKEATEVLVKTFKSMAKIEKKVSEKFTKKVNFTDPAKPELDEKDPEAIRLAANKLVEEGKAKDFVTAIKMLTK